jgi:hypothetical protein
VSGAKFLHFCSFFAKLPSAALDVLGKTAFLQVFPGFPQKNQKIPA